jgi:hypothetical protein
VNDIILGPAFKVMGEPKIWIDTPDDKVELLNDEIVLSGTCVKFSLLKAQKLLNSMYNKAFKTN